MIIPNGTIETKQKTAGGIDPTTGYAAKSATIWSNPVPCQYVPNSHNYLGVASGQHYTQASYTVFIDEQPMNSEQIRLRRTDGSIVGDFSILSVEHLDAVCEMKIIV
jgi:hypothetical protein